MANDLNQCNFIGRLGKDVECRYMPNGDAVASFSLAVGSSWKDKNSGEKKEQTEWVPVAAFGKLGEICSQYLTKGSQVFVSGRFKTDKYKDKDGNDRYTTKIIADTLQMLGSKQGGSAHQNDDDRPAPRQSASKAAPNFSDMDDDIPY